MMTNSDPGFLSNAECIVKASKLTGEELQKYIEGVISKLTELKPGNDKWPTIMLRRCTDCELIKTSHVHHCSMCNECVFIMDHHCCFSDKCIGYKSMANFVRFTSFVSLLTILGVSTIWGNMVIRNIATGEGLVGIYDLIQMLLIQSPVNGINFWTLYDMFLI